MKLFYQPHPCIKPIIKDMIDCKQYMSRVGKHTLVSVPMTIYVNVPYTKTLETIDRQRLDCELKNRRINRVELMIEYVLQFDLDDARSEAGDRVWLSRIKVSINQLNGHKVEPTSVLVNTLEYYYTEVFMKARKQDDFTNIGELDEFRWCSIVKVVTDAEADELEQRRLQTLGCY